MVAGTVAVEVLGEPGRIGRDRLHRFDPRANGIEHDAATLAPRLVPWHERDPHPGRSARAEQRPHPGDLRLLVCNDGLGELLGLGVLSLGQLGLGHLHGAGVVLDHHRQE